MSDRSRPATDRFGHPIDPIVGYARGPVLASTDEEVRRMLKARRPHQDPQARRQGLRAGARGRHFPSVHGAPDRDGGRGAPARPLHRGPRARLADAGSATAAPHHADQRVQAPHRSRRRPARARAPAGLVAMEMLEQDGILTIGAVSMPGERAGAAPHDVSRRCAPRRGAHRGLRRERDRQARSGERRRRRAREAAGVGRWRVRFRSSGMHAVAQGGVCARIRRRQERGHAHGATDRIPAAHPRIHHGRPA